MRTETRIHPDDWPTAIADSGGRQLVVGGPGTGKTEFLVRRLVHLIETGVDPASIAVLSFGRRSVHDLESRLRSRIGVSLGPIEVATYHSFAARLLEVAYEGRWQGVPQLLTGPEQTALVQELLATEDPEGWSPAFRPLLSSGTFATEMTDLILRAAEQMMTKEDLTAAAADRADWRGVPEFVARYRAELRRISRIDYGELLTEALDILRDGDGPGAEVVARIGHVVVDEYQDTTAVQVAMLEALAGDGNLTVAADPYQSIYSFRGSDVRNVAHFTERHPDARRIVLTTSFRTPAAILDAAERITAGEVPGAAGPVVPAPGTGRVDVELFEQLTEEAEWVAAEIQRIHLTDRIPLARIAVFVRSKRRFLPELSRALERRGVAHDTPDARLVDQPAVRLVLDLVAASTEPTDGLDQAAAIRRVLLGDLIGLTLAQSRDLDRRRMREGVAWSVLLRDSVEGGAGVGALIDDDAWATERPAVSGLWHLWTSLPQLQRVVDDPNAADTRAAWASLMQVLTRWNERNPQGTLADFRDLTDDADFEARPLLSYRTPRADRVTLTTLHQSKGLEFDVVFVSDAVEGVFPDLRSRDSLLGVRHLLPHVPTDNPEYVAFRLQEERRLAYTAMTRAARRVVWTATTTGAEEGKGLRSRFLGLVAGLEDAGELPMARAIPAPVTPAEAESRLRQVVADPAEPAPRRVAALATLAEATDHGLRPLADQAGMLPRGSDRGVVPRPLVLSPSQADLYRTCPRRYALERRLHVSDESVYMRFGTLVHEVLERAEQGALDAGRNRSTLAEALRILDEVFDPSGFGGGHVAEHWKRRAVAGLTHLYEHWPKASGSPAALEVALDVEIAGARWIGKADRVERRSAGLAIVDYKTSRSQATRAEAAESIQLAFYAHAVSAHPELGDLGEVVGAEFWYPLITDRKSLAVVPFDASRLDVVLATMEEIAHGIASEDWSPTPGDWCGRCAVSSSCPAVDAGGEGFA